MEKHVIVFMSENSLKPDNNMECYVHEIEKKFKTKYFR